MRRAAGLVFSRPRSLAVRLGRAVGDALRAVLRLFDTLMDAWRDYEREL
jgi:hypothetical protein